MQCVADQIILAECALYKISFGDVLCAKPHFQCAVDKFHYF
jgi:hypothetical protein